MKFTEEGTTNRTYPLYDTHGNMVATVSKNTAGTSWSLGHERSYDVWGSVRSGATSGGPKGRYVANLGHVHDDESGLIYMRARYYEPESGRFLSEDPAMDGSNWYHYCNSDPINYIDKSGKSATTLMFAVLVAGIIQWFYDHFGPQDPASKAIAYFLEATLMAYASVEALNMAASKSDAKWATAAIGFSILSFGMISAIALHMAFMYVLLFSDPWSDMAEDMINAFN